MVWARLSYRQGVGQNIIVAHRRSILRCAPEQLRPATFEEQPTDLDAESQELLGMQRLLDAGSFPKNQLVDITLTAAQIHEQAQGRPEGPSAVPAPSLRLRSHPCLGLFGPVSAVSPLHLSYLLYAQLSLDPKIFPICCEKSFLDWLRTAAHPLGRFRMLLMAGLLHLVVHLALENPPLSAWLVHLQMP